MFKLSQYQTPCIILTQQGTKLSSLAAACRVTSVCGIIRQGGIKSPSLSLPTPPPPPKSDKSQSLDYWLLISCLGLRVPLLPPSLMQVCRLCICKRQRRDRKETPRRDHSRGAFYGVSRPLDHVLPVTVTGFPTTS